MNIRGSPAVLAYFLLALILIFFVSFFLYLTTYGIQGCFLRRISQSLSGKSFQVQIAHLRLHPIQGIVAEDVSILPNLPSSLSPKNLPPPSQAILQINRLSLQPNFHSLIRGKLELNALRLQNANLQLPLPNGSLIHLQNAHASLSFNEKALILQNAQFQFLGVNVRLNATLLNPKAFQPSQRGTLARNPRAADLLQDFLDQLKFLKFPKKSPPSLHLQLVGDLANLHSIAAPKIHFQANSLSWKNVILSNVSFSASLSNNSLLLHHLHAEDDSPQITPGDEGGQLDAAGSYCLTSKRANLAIYSTLDLSPFLRSFSQQQTFNELKFQKSPLLELDLIYDPTSSPSKPLRILGLAQFEHFSFRNVPIQKLDLPFTWHNNFFLARNCSILSQPLTANFHLKFQNSLLNLLAEGYLNPTLCKPWLDKGFRNTVNLMQFEQPGWANVHLLIPTNAPSNLSGNGSIRLGKTATRGAWIDSASANFSVSNQATTFQNLTVSIANRTGTGTLIYDFGNKQILLSSIRSNLPPDKVLLWADPNIVKTIQPYKFRSPPTILANGTVGLTSSSDTNLSLSISSNDGLDYELLGKNLHFSNITASVSIQKNTLLANIHSASLFNGSVQIQTIASLLPSNPTYQLKLNLNRVDFAPLSKLYFDYSESTGKLSGHFSYSSDYSNPENLVGSGHLRIEDGNVFAIPIFGPLSPLISSVIPGAGYQNSRLATASFSVANQTIHTNDLEIVGQGFSLYGSGNIFFVKNQLDLTVRLNVKGTPGFLLFPISKFFEYYSDGSLQNPQWRPKNIPAELYGSGLLEPLTRPVKNLLLPKKFSSPSTPP